ncbi:MAG: type II toxin-antitoxin system prevent-host-death family antitoxin [Candidatus Competibacteraceae bacterium]
MKTASKSVLKAKMLAYFREVETTGEPLLVTSNGQPVLKVVPYRRELIVDEVFADVRGKIRYHGDLLEPTTAEWETS